MTMPKPHREAQRTVNAVSKHCMDAAVLGHERGNPSPRGPQASPGSLSGQRGAHAPWALRAPPRRRQTGDDQREELVLREASTPPPQGPAFHP